jgi:hypothetical protein
MSAKVSAVMPTQGWLQGELRSAILAACKDDEVLFGSDASERSIMFRVGHYFAPAIETRWPGRMWVDLDYNRMAGHERAKVKKRVTGLLPKPDGKRSVLPDLIVHDRSGSSPYHNILVLEAKKRPAAGKAVKYDLAKLAAYKQDLGYQHAVYLELGDQPRWQWINVHDELRPVMSPHSAVSS